LYSAALTIAVTLHWSPGGSDGEAEAGPPGCGATYWRV